MTMNTAAHAAYVQEQLVGPERLRLLGQLLTRHVPARRHTVAAEQVDVEAEQSEDRPRQHVGVQREEVAQRVVAVERSALQQPLERRPHDRRRADDAGRDLRGPVALLIPGQQVAGQRERQHQAEHQNADDPVHLARRLVRAEDHHLREVDAGHDDHR